MKKHGLWQFHRSLHERGSHLKWWTIEEVDQAFTRFHMVSGQWLGGAFIGSPYRKMDIVIRCANRYMRRYGLKRNVETWNSVCTLIGSRMKAHMQTMKAVLHHPHMARKRTPLDTKYVSEFGLPCPVRWLGAVQMRLVRIKQMQSDRADRLIRTCCICNENDAHISRYFWNTERKLLGLEDVLKDRPSYKCCAPCHMKLGKLLKKAKEAEEAKLSIKRFKRKQNESTKNNARAA